MTVAAVAPPPPDRVPIRRALISVSDKTGLIPFATALAARGIDLLSTGGTARALLDAGLTVTEIADHTGSPEILDGRVKTLHPKVHGGILGLRDVDAHVAAMSAHGIAPIDLVVVSLYPFEQARAEDADFATVLENVDIGGPAMIRAAAKNHGHVTVVVDPAEYDAVLAALAAGEGTVLLSLRRRLAATAFARTATYDAMIAAWLTDETALPELDAAFPARLALAYDRREVLRYGENPHQRAAVYAAPHADRPGVATATQLQGKALSYNNLGDTDAAFELVTELDTGPAVAIVKHGNPCGAAVAGTLVDAYRRARACDAVSAFGGIVAVNRPLEADCATAIAEIFTEVVIAPAVTAEAAEVLAKKANLRVLETGAMPDPAAPGRTIRPVAGGLLVQDRDAGRIAAADLKVVTERPPTEAEVADLLFAFRVAKHVKSNAIVYAKGGQTVGIGAGQMSRVDSSRVAAWKAGEAQAAAQADADAATAQRLGTAGSVVASDAFFPFADGLEAAVAAGATAVIQPGGSVRDDEVIAAADRAGLAMVLTGMRHFRH